MQELSDQLPKTEVDYKHSTDDEQAEPWSVRKEMGLCNGKTNSRYGGIQQTELMRKAVRRYIGLFSPHFQWPLPGVWIPTGNSEQLS